MKLTYIIFISLSVAILLSNYVECKSKYSEEINTMELRNEEKPFRMQKLNVIWSKARKRLSPEKLKLLNTELKMQDKEEITWKRLKVEGQDKDGLKEAELRKKLRGILNRYDLNEHFEEVNIPQKSSNMFNEAYDKDVEEMLFKDKKLNKLWIKAERAGFSELELKTLKEEFEHHQEKIEEYYKIMGGMSEDEEMDNSVGDLNKVPKDQVNSKQLLKEKHKELKTNYDRLGKKASLGPDDRGFEEQKVKQLWQLAEMGNFTKKELESLKEELKHYEHRVRKLQHMQSQIDLAEASNKWSGDNTEDRKRMEQKVKQYSHKVEKIHLDIEGRIMQRHLEL